MIYRDNFIKLNSLGTPFLTIIIIAIVNLFW